MTRTKAAKERSRALRAAGLRVFKRNPQNSSDSHNNGGKKRKYNKSLMSKDESYRMLLDPSVRRILGQYVGHWMSLVHLQFDEQVLESRMRILGSSTDRLHHSGVLLTAVANVQKKKKKHKYRTKERLNVGTMLGDYMQSGKGVARYITVRFTPENPSPGTEFPNHKFTPGDLIWISRRGHIPNLVATGQISPDVLPQHHEPPRNRQKFKNLSPGLPPGVMEATIDNAHKAFVNVQIPVPAQHYESQSRDLASGVWYLYRVTPTVTFQRTTGAMKNFSGADYRGPAQLRYIICRLYKNAMEPPQAFWDTAKRDSLDPKYDLQNFNWANVPEPTSQDLYIHADMNSAHMPLNMRMVQESLNSCALNSSQKEAIYSVIQQRLTLIQGPPGTGKTTTAVMLLKFWVRVLRQKTCLASAYSNVAVDQMLVGLVREGIRAIRVGDPSRVNKNLDQYTLIYQEENHRLAPQLEALKNSLSHTCVEGQTSADHIKDLSMAYKKIGKLTKEIESDILNNCDVVLATCIGAGGSPLMNRTFSLVLVDECTQATETACMIPISKLASDGHAVLIGDQCQLPPTVSCDKMKQTSFSISLFERMLMEESKVTAEAQNRERESGHGQNIKRENNGYAGNVPLMGIKPVRLSVQYRMHPLISAWPNQAFYDGQIMDGTTPESRPHFRGFPWPSQLGPICFIPVLDREDDVGNERSKSNTIEGQIVFRVVKTLISHGEIRAKDIGVVTPYAGQVRMMRRLFLRDGRGSRTEELEDSNGVIVMEGQFKDLEIMSVDGYQGREKELIIFSCVRSNNRGNVGFLADKRRLNVAITRAKRGLIVVGNPKTLASDRHWFSWMKFIHENNLVIKEEQMKSLFSDLVRVNPYSYNPGSQYGRSFQGEQRMIPRMQQHQHQHHYYQQQHHNQQHQHQHQHLVKHEQQQVKQEQQQVKQEQQQVKQHHHQHHHHQQRRHQQQHQQQFQQYQQYQQFQQYQQHQHQQHRRLPMSNSNTLHGGRRHGSQSRSGADIPMVTDRQNSGHIPPSVSHTPEQRSGMGSGRRRQQLD